MDKYNDGPFSLCYEAEAAVQLLIEALGGEVQDIRHECELPEEPEPGMVIFVKVQFRAMVTDNLVNTELVLPMKCRGINPENRNSYWAVDQEALEVNLDFARYYVCFGEPSWECRWIWTTPGPLTPKSVWNAYGDLESSRKELPIDIIDSDGVDVIIHPEIFQQ